MIHIDEENSFITRFDPKLTEIINTITGRDFKQKNIGDLLLRDATVSVGWSLTKKMWTITYILLIGSFFVGLYAPISVPALLFFLLAVSYLFKRKMGFVILAHLSLVSTLAAMSFNIGLIGLVFVLIARLMIDIPLYKTLTTFSKQNTVLASLFLFGKDFPFEESKGLYKSVNTLKSKYNISKQLIVQSYMTGVYNSEEADNFEESLEFINKVYEKI